LRSGDAEAMKETTARSAKTQSDREDAPSTKGVLVPELLVDMTSCDTLVVEEER
jgi:hypothetical protein